MDISSIAAAHRLLPSGGQPSAVAKAKPDNTSLEEKAPTSPRNRPLTSNELEPEQQRQLNELKLRDREVRAHEAAHMAAAGGLLIRGANYSYQKGPDDKRYAVGGDVQIDVSPVAGDPNATISKSEQIRRAALAPMKPSSQDIAVAAMASRMAAEARIELIRQKDQAGGQEASAINSYLTIQSNESSQQFHRYA